MSNAAQRIALPEARRPLFVGVDVGGTNTKIGLVDDAGRTVAFTSVPTEEERGPEDAVQRFAHAIRELLSGAGASLSEVMGVGLGSPGSMDIPKGLILEPPNMPHWRYFPLRDRLSDLCNKPVAFANDANAAAFGEFWAGAGRGAQSLVMFTLGTGVGGGIILDGVSIDGVHSFGSELGHMIIDMRDDARHCVWGGGQGQLEAYASAPAVVARTQELLAAGRTSSLSARLDAAEELTPLLLAEEAERGDSLAMEIVLDTARFLAVGIVTVVHAVDPGTVILGGAMNFGGHGTATGRRFLETVRSEFHRMAYHVVADSTTIDFATLGGDAGYIGAAGLARKACHRVTPGPVLNSPR
jgi:glucokinase